MPKQQRSGEPQIDPKTGLPISEPDAIMTDPPSGFGGAQTDTRMTPSETSVMLSPEAPSPTPIGSPPAPKTTTTETETAPEPVPVMVSVSPDYRWSTIQVGGQEFSSVPQPVRPEDACYEDVMTSPNLVCVPFEGEPPAPEPVEPEPPAAVEPTPTTPPSGGLEAPAKPEAPTDPNAPTINPLSPPPPSAQTRSSGERGR